MLFRSAKSVQVYGGEDNDIPVYGKVFISIVPTTGSITAAAKTQIVNDLKSTYSIASVTPAIIDPEYTKLRLNINFVYNSKNTIKAKETLESNVLTTVTNYNTNNLTNFDSAFRHSAFTKLVDDTDDAITSNITTVLFR